jgi:hypothetical protein
MKLLDLFNPFRKPSPEELAHLELLEARRQLLAAMSAQEWATSQVQYNQDRVARLSKTVKEDANG